MLKSKVNYTCEICAFNTSKLTNYNTHLGTRKHMKLVASTKPQQISNQNAALHVCKNCDKTYKDRSGLWRHFQKCNLVYESDFTQKNDKNDKHENELANRFVSTHVSGQNLTVSTVNPNTNANANPNTNANANSTSNSNANPNTDVIYELLKEICVSNAETNKKNIELQTQLLEFMKSQTHSTNNITNTMNNCNNTNTQVNINMFLNEQCKDAITLNAFIQSISPTFDEVLYMANNGNKEGLYKILKKSFSQIELTKRPMHCTDLKRHTTYVKDETGWLKEHDQTHLRKLCGKVEHACLVKTLAIIEGDERYTTNGTEEYEDSIRMMQESVGGRKGPVYNHGLILKSLEEQIALDQEKMKNTIKN